MVPAGDSLKYWMVESADERATRVWPVFHQTPEPANIEIRSVSRQQQGVGSDPKVLTTGIKIPRASGLQCGAEHGTHHLDPSVVADAVGVVNVGG